MAPAPLEHRPTVLVLLGCFSRGVEATGPNQSMIGMARALRDHFRFRVVAEAVDGDRIGEWGEVSGIEQLPLASSRFGASGLRRVLNRTACDAVVTNGFFDRNFTIPLLVLRRLRLIPRRPVMVAPRGEFSPGALRLNHRRKRAYIAAARTLGLLRGVTLQATSDAEARDIRRALPFAGEVVVTPNIRPPSAEIPARPRAPGAPLRVAFLSRIDRKKNLDFVTDVLARAGVPVDFTIFGPVSDPDYWQACQRRMASLPPRVSVHHAGTLPQSAVGDALAGQDLFFLPSLGENFGHAIADAMLAGTPVLLSDQTPWRGLEAAGVGWDLPLNDPGAFVAAVQRIAGLDVQHATTMRRAARAFAERALNPGAAALSLARALAALIGDRSSTTTRLAPGRSRNGDAMTQPMVQFAEKPGGVAPELGRRVRVAFLNTHPIQYAAPLYAYLADTPDIEPVALYLSDLSLRGAVDRQFGREVVWDIDLLAGYEYHFVGPTWRTDRPDGFFDLKGAGLWQALGTGRFDALVLHGHNHLANLVALAAARFHGIPVLYKAETHLLLPRRRIKGALRPAALKALFSQMAGFLYIGSRNRAFYRSLGIPDDRLWFYPYTVENDRLVACVEKSASKRSATRQSLGLVDGVPVVTYASKFMRRKHPEHLILAAKRLVAQGVQLQLLMIGSGELESELRAMAETEPRLTIVFAGFMNQSELPRALAASDVFVLPSEDEPFGLIVNEAMCAGLPVIASEEVGCVGDLVRHGENGATFEAGDVAGLAAALAQIVTDPALRSRMAERSRALISLWSYRDNLAGLRLALSAIVEKNR